MLNVATTTAISRTRTNWHHLVVAVDTTQATAANRVILYLGWLGLRTWDHDLSDAEHQSLEQFRRLLIILDIPEPAVRCSGYFNGKMAQLYYIDGQQLTPSSFITGTPGVPKTYSGTYTGAFRFLPAVQQRHIHDDARCRQFRRE